MYPESLPDDRIVVHKSISYFKSKEDNVEAFIMKDYSLGMHCQEFYEINIVLKGSGCHYINNSKIEVKVGDAFIIPPNLMHGYAGGEGFDVFQLLLSVDFFNMHISDFARIPSFFTLFDIEPTLRARTQFVPSLSLENDKFDDIRVLIEQILQHSSAPDTTNRLLLGYYSVILIVQLCNIYNENIIIHSKDNNFMNSLSLIYCNYAEKLTIQRLADEALMSRTAYINKFEELFGTTPGQFLINRRITVAKELLGSTQYSVEKIAELTGFHDASHLIRFFTRSEEISPAEFRNKSAGGL